MFYEIKPWFCALISFWAITSSGWVSLFGVLLLAVAIYIITMRAEHRRWWPYF